MNMHVKAGFKVGDRVKWNGKGEDFIAHWMKYWAKPGEARPEFFYVTYVSSGGKDITYSVTPTGAGPQCPTSYFIPAPLYAVGDKVRAVKRACDVTVGNVYAVVEADDEDVRIIDDVGESNWLSHDRVEPYTEQPAAPKFKAGDRVRAVSNVGCSRFTVGNEYTVTRADDQDNFLDETQLVRCLADDGKDRGQFGSRWELVAVAPATATTTLTIQAGKFYQTRDGRKVGPMVERGEETAYPWLSEFKGGVNDPHRLIFTKDGKNYTRRHLDIIAEWPVEVVADATTAKFKVGDRVKFRDDYGSDARGKAAVVIDVPPSSWGIQVRRTDDGDVSTESPSSLVPLPASPTSIADIVRKHSGTAIVCLLENGQPKPSALPYVHHDRAGAIKEANRLAGVNKGQEFGVYECVDVKKVDPPAKVYDHEWQRLAAGGQKINAIRELRGMTGLGLATSKDAVEDWLRRTLLAA